MFIARFNRHRADRLHKQAQACSKAGDEDAALALYARCLSLDPDRDTTLYNVGLIYKYRGDWEQSFDFNARAYAISPRDEATRWNLAIAATALRRWVVARQAWTDNGLLMPDGDGPITMDFGLTPVRLDPAGRGEVVWARRIDPVRARITSIPFPESGFRLNDVVLHDGAAVGSRTVDGREYSVFNVLELFEPSALSTYVMVVRAPTADQLDSLERLAESMGVAVEDWTASVRALCRQCSEGAPHETHDNDRDPDWQVERRMGMACADPARMESLVQACRALDQLEIVEVGEQVG
ncbi:hypothetical protein ASD55_11860 [Rhodanobacter sp. Root561]|uniref:tetratricopeptide repeat protein n=1 Tax=Rhodanobacter sp. Root561 TaxID=1736560 RepID=UPI00071248DB|nr:tetratricopeptide repeat protein [Rhodanobacter sp. Root561]KQZ70970.1 hypothetical protein ASD55_11860 [Rhodanobacter sp. Root561]